MGYEKELEFLLDFLKNYQIKAHIYTIPYNDLTDFDLQLRKILGFENEYQILQNFLQKIQSNHIYHLTDNFTCIYYIIPLPNIEQPSVLMVGPYVKTKPDTAILMENMEKYSISTQFFKQIEHYYYSIPLLKDDEFLQILLHTLYKKIWKSGEHVIFQTLNPKTDEISMPNIETPFLPENELVPTSPDIIFAKEKELTLAISKNDLKKAENLLDELLSYYATRYSDNFLRNSKNDAIMLNTILRKSAEFNNVSPFHIWRISENYLKKINTVTTLEQCKNLQQEMVRHYCLSIQNYSLKQYPPLIQSTLKLIDSNFSNDLSLKIIAKELNVNPSYLSRYFKQIMGSTLTDYINRKRIDYAIFLLNTTNLQIQTIAQYCGISDVNYFTKLFKKFIFITPSVYRKKVWNTQQNSFFLH